MSKDAATICQTSTGPMTNGQKIKGKQVYGHASGFCGDGCIGLSQHNFHL